MKWIHEYQCFLFDFDGLLVNTEEIHFLAYKKLCARYSCDLDWDFARYCQAAHYLQEGLRDQIYERFPSLCEQEPLWDVLYAQKKEIMVELLKEGAVHMMSGAENLLKALEKANIKRAVVTHSSNELVSLIREKNPILNSIPYWITREHYTKPKPDPECYQKAIEMLTEESDNVIGFEDTPRGLTALIQTRAQACLITKVPYPEIEDFKSQGAYHFGSLERIE